MIIKEQHIIRKTVKICFGIFTLLLLILFLAAGIKNYIDHKKLQATVVENNSIINKIEGKTGNEVSQTQLSIPNEILASTGMSEMEIRELVNNMFDQNGNITEEGEKLQDIIEQTIVENNEYITYEQVQDHSDEIQSLMREMAGLQQAGDNLNGKIDQTEDSFSDIVDEIKKNFGESLFEKSKESNDRMDNMENDITNKISSLESDTTNRIGDLERDMTNKIDILNNDINNKFEENNEIINNRVTLIENQLSITNENYQNLSTTLIEKTDEINNRISNLSADEVSYDKSRNAILVSAATVQEAIDELGKSVGDGKQELADAITTRYSQASETPATTLSKDSSFTELSNAIKMLPVNITVQGNSSNPKIIYLYHHHILPSDETGCGKEENESCDNDSPSRASSSGGCYTKVVPHSHGGSCYSSCNHRGVYIHVYDDGDRYRADCSRCGRRGGSGSSGEYKSSDYALEDLYKKDGSYLTCSKTIDGYAPNCGYADGQILKAEIEF